MTDVEHRIAAEPTAIPGMFVVDAPVHTDDRGSFTEAFRRERLVEAGLPDLEIVQQNVATNTAAGVTRGVHAEPWDKYVTVINGRAFQAVVDLRDGSTFGRVATVELVPGRAVLIPRGCGNAYQALDPGTAYSYLVTGYWSVTSAYVAVDPFDADLAIPWPISAERATLSAKDRANPPLREVTPLPAQPTPSAT
jgi:dTDP-4-dehydrorhamnose 3,5-epimerase/reductase